MGEHRTLQRSSRFGEDVLRPTLDKANLTGAHQPHEHLESFVGLVESFVVTDKLMLMRLLLSTPLSLCRRLRSRSASCARVCRISAASGAQIDSCTAWFATLSAVWMSLLDCPQEVLRLQLVFTLCGKKWP